MHIASFWMIRNHIIHIQFGAQLIRLDIGVLSRL